MSHGLTLLASYTNSKSIDDSSVSTSTEWIGGFGAMRDPNNLKLERSLSEWDIPQVFQLSYVWQLPFGRGKNDWRHLESCRQRCTGRLADQRHVAV